MACAEEKQFQEAYSHHNILPVLEYYQCATLNLEKYAEQGLLWSYKYKSHTTQIYLNPQITGAVPDGNTDVLL